MITIENYKKNLNILYVEDDALTAARLKKVLIKIFNKVIIVSNEEDAFEELKKTKIDLILSDLNKPKNDSLKFLEKLRRYNSKIHFVFITTGDEPDKMLKAIQLGIDNYILKPIHLQNLLSIIDVVVEKLYKENLALENFTHLNKLKSNLK